MFHRSLSIVALSMLAMACAPARAQVAYSDAEIAYFAARLQQADFEREEATCSGGKWRKALAGGLADYQRANPGYGEALAMPSPSAQLTEAVERKLADYARVYDQMARMLAMMSQATRDKLCDEAIAERTSGRFDDRIASTRKILAENMSSSSAPASAPASASAPVALASADVQPVVAAVLQHPEVAKYLHPEVSGRVPVRVAIVAPYDGAPLDLALYGAPIKRVGADDISAIRLAIKPQADRVVVEVRYKPEGIFGHVNLIRQNGVWTVQEAEIFE